MLLVDRSRPYRTLLKVVVVLLAVEYWVRGPFFQRYVVPREVSRFVMLRERTAGRQPSLPPGAGRPNRGRRDVVKLLSMRS